MTETETPKEQAPETAEAEAAGKSEATEEEPSLLDSVGSFPYWMLKVINTVTPDFLRSKEPPKKNYRI